MQATLNPPATSIDNVVQDRTQIQLVFIEAAIRKQQNFRELGDDKNMIKMYRTAVEALDELGEYEHLMRTHKQLGELWERAGKQLKGTSHYAEHNHCFTSAMAHYKEANKHERFMQAFGNLYGK